MRRHHTHKRPNIFPGPNPGNTEIALHYPGISCAHSRLGKLNSVRVCTIPFLRDYNRPLGGRALADTDLNLIE